MSEVFYYAITTDSDKVIGLVEKLNTKYRRYSDTYTTNCGSSFGVTVDTHPLWTLWLTKSSLDYLTFIGALEKS